MFSFFLFSFLYYCFGNYYPPSPTKIYNNHVHLFFFNTFLNLLLLISSPYISIISLYILYSHYYIYLFSYFFNFFTHLAPFNYSFFLTKHLYSFIHIAKHLAPFNYSSILQTLLAPFNSIINDYRQQKASWHRLTTHYYITAHP